MRRSRFRAISRDRFWYFAPTGLNGAIAIGSLPILIAAVGSKEWAQIALGQSVGLIGAVVLGLGWPITGPSEVARALPAGQYEILVRSLKVRLLLAVPVAGLMVVGASFLPGAWNQLFLSTSIVSALLGLTSSWFFLGLDRPVALFFMDSLTRGLGTIFGLLLTVIFRDALLYACGIGVGIGVSIFAALGYARRRSDRKRVKEGLVRLVQEIRRQAAGMAYNISYVGLSSLAVPASSFLGSETFSTFAVIDKVQKQFVTIMLPIVQIVVGKMTSGIRDDEDILSASRRSLRDICLSGLFIFCASFAVSSTAINLLSLGVVQFDVYASAGFSLLVVLAFSTQCIPIAILAPLSRLRFGLIASLLGVVCLIPSIWFLGRTFLAAGVLWSSVVSFAVCLGVLLVGVQAPRKS